MAAELKPIQTRYKGYLFRSRMEARWAVFFDALSIHWEYEPEGFECENGERYLPDFYLPSFDLHGLYVEVKPEDRDEFGKAQRWAAFAQKQLLCVIGVPAWRSYELAVPGNGTIALWSVHFCDKYLPGGANGDEYRLYYQPEWTDGNSWAASYNQNVLDAIAEARSARFEYDEGRLRGRVA